MAAPGRLPVWLWLFPAATAAAAILLWTAGCGSETGTWLGGALVAATGLLVYAFSLEALPRRSGPLGSLRRFLLALLLGLLGGVATFLAAGGGYQLACSPL
jgi:hypothetical protein